VRNDFTYNVVAGHSSTTTPAFYKLAAPWSSQEGSLLLWVFLLSGWSSLVLFATRKRVREIAPYATAVLLGSSGVVDVGLHGDAIGAIGLQLQKRLLCGGFIRAISNGHARAVLGQAHSNAASDAAAATGNNRDFIL